MAQNVAIGKHSIFGAVRCTDFFALAMKWPIQFDINPSARAGYNDLSPKVTTNMPQFSNNRQLITTGFIPVMAPHLFWVSVRFDLINHICHFT
jgi:hypothetical protein